MGLQAAPILVTGRLRRITGIFTSRCKFFLRTFSILFLYILMSLILKWAHLTHRLLWRVARAVLKEYPGVLNDPLAPSDSCGVAARAVQEQCSGVLGNPLTLSDSCGSVARAVPSVLAGGAC
ncbi:hypothetical protein NDU88_004299 [Pleurodeles waltl]|uniref:Uncharacterized protein n=1 Tax=Pleurodeles waltl TaxID=8319 RepID=A0AAV7VJV1_PLEWA|nr:hypothetical protein NDU88_004299 [Pleurodeles waltl]